MLEFQQLKTMIPERQETNEIRLGMALPYYLLGLDARKGNTGRT